MNATLSESNTLADVSFLALVDIESPHFDKARAKAFAMANFAELSENSKFLFHHAFPDVAQKAFTVSPEPFHVKAGFMAQDALQS